MENSIEKTRVLKAVYVFVIILSIFFVVKIITGFRDYRTGDAKTPSTISLTGHGEVNAVPDIASVYFTISKDAKTAKEAQDAVAVVEKKALDVVKADGVADKDTKTADASVYPKYEYKQALCPQAPNMGPQASPIYCGGNQVITGYTASESITVKIRKVDDAGKVMQDLGSAGISNLNGPNFTIDDQDALKASARKLAIDDAKAKAESLAKDLGVRLVKITSFSDSSGGYPMPYYAKDMAMATGAVSAPAQLPKGENTISSDVTITYEIR